MKIVKILLVILLFIGCGKRLPITDSQVYEQSWLIDYRIFYRTSSLIIQAKINSEVITDFNFDNLQIQITENGKKYIQISQSAFNTSKKTETSFEITLKQQFIKNYFQLILLQEKEKYYSQWKKAVKLGFVPKPITKFGITEKGETILVFANRNQYGVRFYDNLKLLPVAEFNNNSQITGLAFDSLMIRYYDKYGNESDMLIIK